MNLAASSNSKLIGFNVRADSKAKKLIEINNQELFYFSVIYELIDHVKNQLSGLLEPDIKEEIIGIAEVKDVYRSSKIGTLNLLLFSILDPLPVLTASGIHFASMEASTSRGESPIA